jgi:hypothetical protein
MRLGAKRRTSGLAMLLALGSQAGMPDPLVAQVDRFERRTEMLEAEVRSSRGFTDVVGVRELGNGRVILVDQAERVVYLLVPDLSEARPIGRHGRGPGEYLMPAAIFPLAGDSSAIFDAGQQRYVLITPEGRPVHWRMESTAAGVAPGRVVDRSGAHYRHRPPLAASREDREGEGPAAWIERWDPRSRSWQAVARIPVDPEAEVGRPGRPALTPAGARTAFRPLATWAVADDGAVAIVHAQPYLVEITPPQGALRRGPPVPYEPIPVTDLHKDQWRERVRAPRPAVVGVIGDPGSFRVETLSPPGFEPAAWADHLPPFRPGTARFAPDGTLWVPRLVDPGEPLPVDVFDRSGYRVRQVALPPDVQLVGFGAGSVYVVQEDDLDVQFLLRVPVEWTTSAR